jgi:hypothetical protein
MTMPVLPDDEFGDSVYKYRVGGATERQCAKRFGITVQEVRRHVVPRVPSNDHEARALEVQLDLERFNTVAQRFYAWTMETDEPTVACATAAILIRLSERKGAILGLDHAPMRRDQVTILDQTPKTESSTARIRAVIEAVTGKRPPVPPKLKVVGGDDDALPLPPKPDGAA